MVVEIRDEFLSEDDMNLSEMSFDEIVGWWNEWLRIAQQTNDYDRNQYSHGVFMGMEEPHGAG
jgi:hypothetical protein